MTGSNHGLATRRGTAPRQLARPPLTSLVDMMVILLVFLLKSFSVEGQLVTPAADLRLPASRAEEAAGAALSIAVATSGIAVDGVRVADLPDPAGADLLVAPLHEALVALAPRRDDVAGPRRVNVQCDRGMDFAVLERVLHTCSRAGYDDLALLVVREGS